MGSFAANAFGVHDMLGNVWEWVGDCWNGPYEGAPRDGSAWGGSECVLPILRGGSWSDNPRIVRAASRIGNGTGYRSKLIGFRVARTLD